MLSTARLSRGYSALVKSRTVQNVRIRGLASTVSDNSTGEMFHDDAEYQDLSEMARKMVKGMKIVAKPRNLPDRVINEKSLDPNTHNAWAYRCEIRTHEDGKLKGKTIAVKDNIAVAGIPMSSGSRLLQGFIPNKDATVVHRILEAGGTVAGKAQCEDMCFSASSFTSYPKPVTNPRNPDHVAGGSSSGSAALVAASEVDMALGTDQGGSIRVPSAWCGIVGLKPTHGLVPYTGASSLDLRLDHIGPMARTVDDCALLLEVIAGYDGGRDIRQSQQIKVPEYSKEIKDASLNGRKIAVVGEGFKKIRPEIEDEVKNVLRNMANNGASMIDCSIQEQKLAASAFPCIFMMSLYRSIFDKTDAAYQCHLIKAQHDFISKNLPENAQLLSPTLKLLAIIGDELKNDDVAAELYEDSLDGVAQLSAAYDAVLSDCDVMIMPTVPFPAPKFPDTNAKPSDQVRQALNMTTFTQGFNLTGHPALSLNVSTDKNALPVGLMVIGKRYDDLTVLKVARCIENMLQK